MLKNYFKIAWRNIIRHKGYSAINISGLTVGIAACLIIFVVVQYELSFDTFQPGYKSTYRVTTQTLRDAGIERAAGVSAPAVDALLRQKLPPLNRAMVARLPYPPPQGTRQMIKSLFRT